jgi:hypothetical protein
VASPGSGRSPLAAAGPSQGGGYAHTTATIDEVTGWVAEVNSAVAQEDRESALNCVTTALAAVFDRLFGSDTFRVAPPMTEALPLQVLSNNLNMDLLTGARWDRDGGATAVAALLKSQGPGAHTVVNVHRMGSAARSGEPDVRAAGHSFNALFDGEHVYYIDAQADLVQAWPPPDLDTSTGARVVSWSMYVPRGFPPHDLLGSPPLHGLNVEHLDGTHRMGSVTEQPVDTAVSAVSGTGRGGGARPAARASRAGVAQQGNPAAGLPAAGPSSHRGARVSAPF